MLDIPDVELDALVPGQASPAVDLRPARDSRLDVEPTPLARCVALHLIRQRRTGADQAHVPPRDVPELRQLVDRETAQDAPDTRDARVAFVHRESRSLRFRADVHRPELEQLELLSVHADTSLPVEDR